uniref:M48 family metalloprotease n=1 Tax=uncultured Erythrobacter sp. TaxID=263913 RepID=UPI00263257A6|nr:M48 family metalloprotease [uncultured Erythrobacter sp.]
MLKTFRNAGAALAGVGAIIALAAVPANSQSLGGIIGSAKKVAAAASVSDEEIVAYFGQMSEKMDASNPIATPDDPYGARLAALTEGLDSYDGLDLDIKAYLVKDVNAFAMGDGTVRIMAGLMDKFEDDEVRCVIGHEIGHVKLRHGQKRMKRALQQDAALSVAGTASGDARRIANSELGGLIQNVMYAQHSQKAERSSDDYALEFMAANGYNQEACATAMDKLAEMSAGGGVELLRTHPSPAKRAKRMRKKIS